MKTPRTKSPECSEVLQLMDKDFTYSEALKQVLNKYKNLKKEDLEKEIDFYI